MKKKNPQGIGQHCHARVSTKGAQTIDYAAAREE